MPWDEVADRCFRRRYESFDVTVGVVLGEHGAVLIDTRASLAQGHELRADLRELGVIEPYAVINTHGHFDHCLGNTAFRPLFGRWGHVSLPGYLAGPVQDDMAQEFPEWAAQVAGEPVAAPDRLVVADAELDLGDRTVVLTHPGPGHTAGDLAVWVPDAECLFAGDLVEQSGPPAYGPDSFPLDWPDTLDRLARLYEGDHGDGDGDGDGQGDGASRDVVIVPGHGEPVDPGYVAVQRSRIGRVAELIHAAYVAGLDPESALGIGPDRPSGGPAEWPYNPDLLSHAVRRGYAQLDVSFRGSAGQH